MTETSAKPLASAESLSVTPAPAAQFPWYRRERLLALLALLLLAGSVLLVEVFLLQRTTRYFGGSFNQPQPLTSAGQIALFLFEAFSYNLLLAATLGLLMLWLLTRFTRVEAPCRVLVTTVFLGASAALIVGLRYRLYEYFKDAYSFGILKVVADGDLRNIFNWISVDAVLKIAAMLTAAVGVVVAVALVKWRGEYLPWASKRTAIWVVMGAWLLLGANDFSIVGNEKLRYGLASTVAYSAVHAILTEITDFDRDGYGPLTKPPDSNNFNSAIFPYAVDVPGDGIDQDGLCGDLAASEVASQTVSLRPLARPNRKNVIVAVIETFRTDVIDATRDGQEVMPFLDGLGKQYAYTTAMYSNFGVTARAIQTIFSGNLHYNLGDRTLLDHLRGYGYRTYAASGQDESWGNTDRLLSFSRLTHVYDSRNKKWDASKMSRWHRLHHKLPTLDSAEVDDAIAAMLDDADKNPFAMYVNFQDLHYPYYSEAMEKTFIRKGEISSDFFQPQNRAAILVQYANGAHHLDKGIARLFQELDRRGLRDNTVVVIVGDHPDSVYEDGIMGHAWALDEHQRKTPFFVANGRGDYSLPMGQDEIAAVILNSLDDGSEAGPMRFHTDPEKKIFELTGTLDAPRELGWISPSSLTTFDFRNWRYQADGSARWTSVDAIKPGHPAYDGMCRLVNRWEVEHYLQARGARQQTQFGGMSMLDDTVNETYQRQ